MVKNFSSFSLSTMKRLLYCLLASLDLLWRSQRAISVAPLYMMVFCFWMLLNLNLFFLGVLQLCDDGSRHGFHLYSSCVGFTGIPAFKDVCFQHFWKVVSYYEFEYCLFLIFFI